tara:strand:- start:475 stop:1224 length:750 start_codon:yes stop_codon:yes gene_type:complete
MEFCQFKIFHYYRFGCLEYYIVLMENLTVIVPVYNEELFLEQSLDRLLALEKDFKILIVDDCSSDNSPNIAQQYAKEYEYITFIKKDNNGGKGSVLKEAFKHVNTDFSVIHDADLEYFPQDLLIMYKNMDKNSFVLGSRFIGNIKRENIYLRTYIANKVMSYFFSIVFLKKVTDIATCYKMFPSHVIQSQTIKERGFSIEIEIAAKLIKSKLNYSEVPIKYSGRTYDEGKKIKFSDGILYLVNTIKYRF